MVRRNVDTARGPMERITANQAKLEDLSRAHGRGTTAVRDSAGNILEMNGDAPYPLMTPQGIDSAVAFMPDGTVKITSTDTTEDRDMTVRDIASSGNVAANRLSTSGDVVANGSFVANGSARFNGTMTAGNVTTGNANLQNVYANGTLNSTGFTFVGGGLKVGETYDTVGGRITSRELTTLGNMACDGTFYYKNQVNTSDERLKKNFAPLDGSALRAFAEVMWQSWEWIDPPTTEPTEGPARRHVMATAQSLRAHPLLRLVVAGHTGPGSEDSDVLGIDTVDLLGVVCAALAEASERIESQQRQIDDLTRRIAAQSDAR